MKPREKNPEINSLQELMEHHGFASLYDWWVDAYRQSSSGPRVWFIIEDRPERLAESVVKVTMKGTKPFLEFHSGELPSDVTLRKFGFNPDGTCRIGKRHVRSLKAYRELVTTFLQGRAKGRAIDQTEVHMSDPVTGVSDRGTLWMTLREKIPPVLRRVTYDDAECRKPGVPEGRCVGIEIGACVEGSDVEVGPYQVPFPCTVVAIENMVYEVSNEAEFYWERDNLESVEVTMGKESWYVDIRGRESFEELPRKIRNKVADFCLSNKFETLPESVRLRVPNCPRVRVLKIDKAFYTW